MLGTPPPRDSDRDAVVHAYRSLARATHPDVSDDPDAADRFATVAAAYQLVQDRVPNDPKVPRHTRGHPPPAASDAPGRGAEGSPGPASGWRSDGPVPIAVGPRRMSTILGGRRHETAPTVAGPAWVEPPRRPVDTEVRDG